MSKKKKQKAVERQRVVYRDRKGKLSAFRRNKFLSVWITDRHGKVVRQLLPLSRLGKRIGKINPISKTEELPRSVPASPKRGKKGWLPIDRVTQLMFQRDKELANAFGVQMPFFAPPRKARYAKLMPQVRYTVGKEKLVSQPYLFADEPVGSRKRIKTVWVSVLQQWEYEGKPVFVVKQNIKLVLKRRKEARFLFNPATMGKFYAELLDLLETKAEKADAQMTIVDIQGVSV